MNILTILYAGLGGHGNVFFSFIKADENKRFDYEVIFAGVEDVREEYIAKSNIYNLQWKYIRKKRGFDIGFNRKLISAIKASRSPVIFLHGSRFIVLAKIAALITGKEKKIIVRETQSNHLKTFFDWCWLIFALLFADHIIFLTESFNEEVRKKLKWIYQPKKIGIINNGIDLTIFKPAPKTPASTIVLGMQGRIVPIKDHETLLYAFSLLQHDHPELTLQLKIAGDGDSLHLMKQLAKQLEIENKVLFTGMLDEVNLVSFMQSLDIYIHASLGETMSTAIIQAMACKLPIIASDVPGINNMIENDITGILVPVKNIKALAAAIYNMITNSANAEAMKEAAFNFASLNYSNKTMFAKYQALIEIC